MCSILFLESKSACWSSLSSSRVEISSSTWEWVITWLVFANIRNWNWGSPLYFWWTRHLNLGSPRKGRLEDSGRRQVLKPWREWMKTVLYLEDSWTAPESAIWKHVLTCSADQFGISWKQVVFGGATDMNELA